MFGLPGRNDERDGRTRRVRLHGVDVMDGEEVLGEGLHGVPCERRNGWAVAEFLVVGASRVSLSRALFEVSRC